MPVSNLNLYFSRGDSRTVPALAQDYQQNIINLTGATVTCDARRDPRDTTPVFTKTIANGGITVTNAAAGLFTINILPADTASLADYSQSLYYDCKVTTSGGATTTVLGGKIYLSANISY